jgi:hypothetical protein
MFLKLVGNIFASREANSLICFRNNVSTGGQTWKLLRKHRESQIFPQQCFLVCPGLYDTSVTIEVENLTLTNE